MKSPTIIMLLLSMTTGLFAQANIDANGLTIGRYGQSFLGDTNPFAAFHSDGTRDLILFGNNTSTLHLRMYDGDIKIGPNQSATSVLYNNGSLFLGGSVGNRLTIGGEGNLNFRLGRWIAVSETGGGLATVLGNNIQSSVTTNNYMEFITTSGDGGGRAIKLQYDEGITFHTIYGATSAGTQFTGNERMRITNSGNVGIGTASPTNKLEVNGVIRSKEVRVEASPWPDYVFAEKYALPTLAEVEAYIKEHKHLPEVPAESDVADGVNLGEMNAILLKKIEELTLYIIRQDKRVNDLESQLVEVKKLVKQ